MRDFALICWTISLKFSCPILTCLHILLCICCIMLLWCHAQRHEKISVRSFEGVIGSVFGTWRVKKRFQKCLWHDITIKINYTRHISVVKSIVIISWTNCKCPIIWMLVIGYFISWEREQYQILKFMNCQLNELHRYLKNVQNEK